ncbi:hypothetical protein M2351_004032 [Azospirillum canadense]|nr:hypothetical protein [Azospirillum canadense]MCW2239402.1 hypothetical protein [Azospirillum canadense]
MTVQDKAEIQKDGVDHGLVRHMVGPAVACPSGVQINEDSGKTGGLGHGTV